MVNKKSLILFTILLLIFTFTNCEKQNNENKNIIENTLKELTGNRTSLTEEDIERLKELIGNRTSLTEEDIERLKELKEQLDNEKEYKLQEYLSERPYEIDTKNTPQRGSGELGVEIIIFQDFECPACRNLSITISQLMDYYDNKLSLRMKHYPLEPECFPIEIGALHEFACEASYAALAAQEQGKFWEYYDLLFSNRVDNTGLFTKYAKKLGLDMEKFEKDYNSEEVKNRVKRDAIEGHYNLRLSATPTIFINNFKYDGRKDLTILKKLVEYFKKYPNAKIKERLEGEEDEEKEDFKPEEYLSEKIYDIDTENSPVRGTNELGVEIIVYEDFECPACRRTAQELEKLFAHYDRKITLIFKHYPLEEECFPMEGLDKHEMACEASYAALAVQEQGKFWEYYDLLYSQKLTDTKVLEEYAKELGLDIEKFRKDYDSEELRKIIERDTNEGFKDLKIMATPTLFFNKRKYKGHKEFEELKKLVDYLIDKE